MNVINNHITYHVVQDIRKDAMEKLHKYDLVKVIHEVIARKTPFLGICLGLQLLFESSEESAGVPGLGILKGKIVRFDDKPGYKIPHMGWNSLHIAENARLFILCTFLLSAGRR